MTTSDAPASAPVSSDWLVGPNPSTEGAQPLSAAEVGSIIDAAQKEAKRIRAAIRLPLQARTAMVIAVYDHAGADLVKEAIPNAIRTSVAQIEGTKAKDLKAGLAEAQAGMTA